MVPRVLLELTLVLSIHIHYNGACTVGNGKTCIFPFRHKNVTYAGCTDVGDPDNRLWCSTEVDSLGDHVTGVKAWEHCHVDCPTARERLYPDCRVLRVKDQDEEFSSGVYHVDQTLQHNGRTVYVNKDKELYIFWLHNEAGWGLGYASGLTSGGSFYSSGASIIDEPWLGSWAETKITVSCDITLPFLATVPTIPQETRQCTGDQTCLAREDCPAVETAYLQLLGRRKDDPTRKPVLDGLKKMICNMKQKGFCCQQSDQEVCELGSTCSTISDCPSNRESLDTIHSRNLPYNEVKSLYVSLKSKVCDTRNKMFCCK